MLYFVYFLLWLIYFMLGASIFSFLTVVADRLPRKETVLRGRSHCDSCSHTLSAIELIPCFSFLALRGRCRHCGGKIPVRCLVMEAVGGLAMIACIECFPGNLWAVALSMVVMSILAVVALVDWDTQEIWNRFWIALFICGCAAVFVFPQVSFLQRAIGAFAVSVPMLLLALAVPGGFGGGDIKLMFAAGWLLGWKAVLCAVFLAILLGGGYGISLLIRRRAGRKDAFAFGPFLCIGIAVALLWGEGIIGWYLSLF